MAEDIIDFGPAGAPPHQGARSQMSWRPNLPVSAPLALAIAGAIAAAAAMVVPWQKVTFDTGSDILGTGGNNTASLTVDQAGAYGWAFVVGILGLFTVTAVALFTPGRARRVACIAGLGLSVGVTLIVAVLTYKLSKTSPYFSPFSQLTDQMKFNLDWGPYAGLATTVAIGLSLFMLRPVTTPSRVHASRLQEPDDIELEVSVEPA